MTNKDSVFEEIKNKIADFAKSKDNFFNPLLFISDKEDRKREKAKLVNKLQEDLAGELRLLNGNNDWIWATEHLLMTVDESSRVKDKADIYGVSKDGEYQVIVELDPHRADAIAKKFTSRIAAVLPEVNNSNGKEKTDKIYAKKTLYVVFIYLGTEKMSINETQKYIRYCKKIGKHVGVEVVDYHTSDLDKKWGQ